MARPILLIIETSDNRLFSVSAHPDAALAHVFVGIPVKRSGGSFVPKANATERLIRRAGCRVVAQG